MPNQLWVLVFMSRLLVIKSYLGIVLMWAYFSCLTNWIVLNGLNLKSCCSFFSHCFPQFPQLLCRHLIPLLWMWVNWEPESWWDSFLSWLHKHGCDPYEHITITLSWQSWVILTIDLGFLGSASLLEEPLAQMSSSLRLHISATLKSSDFALFLIGWLSAICLAKG